ncbi:glycoside hydrolase TIM-barrel-like domain-containing protein [Phaeobacter sp. PT47_59]|uniref:baseplate multidomain protein megatron n=1 Tax=Phaeobacter sp. PT47_59 TaxID=3029979 RepID=UPI00238036CD|nr:glycoside hydrolase TIM-barrel-like domain-containing protein [Phaeobacter sp. PT47_59]MDE4172634.1 glycoside hydrolase TIM-barrel-like domain-containing protein [Phaeobacter sp. PT47_59]
MATILLSAAGAAIGGAVGGTVAGLSSVAIGRAIGATLGRAMDERLFGAGSDPVETGRISQFRLTQASEGEPIAQVFGRTRVGGQVIWATRFLENSETSGGGKGAPRQPSVTRYSYSVSLAIALCEGEITSVARVWADGEEVSPLDLNMTVYRGTAEQAPDPLMEAVEGAGEVPAYRGTAYVVMENVQLERFGNRVPQFSFEVIRGEQPNSPDYAHDPAQLLRGVALMPGTGEYALAASPVNYSGGPGDMRAANTHTPSGQTDLVTSLKALEDELPACDAASLIVSWFGDDLRCGACRIKPKVEQKQADGVTMPWVVSGVSRASADEVLKDEEENPVYGGTPADAAVIEAIQTLRDQGRRVMFYPFILMDQPAGNGLPDPWSDKSDQPHLPWRGRITLSVAPGRDGSPDRTAAADAEVATFMGQAVAADFTVTDGAVSYTGPEDWGLRRFILHNAALCAAAGGVEAFCIGSEMRSLTQIRGASAFPAVEALRDLAGEVRQILGAEVKIGYAADWSEYWGYTSPEGNRYFHLDPLWADPQIDFIGIDNYMPLSDWRQGEDHLDAEAGVPAIYDLDYLRGNIEGGEGYDWFYHSPEAEVAQIRTPITDGAHDEPWIWRYKDIRNWWGNTHHERINGVRQPFPTAWEPQSKPIWFTELGCAAIDRGTNQPNKFLDPKSSESKLPKFSNGQRDDLIQLHYLRAMLGYWSDPAHNPISSEYGGPMLDMANAYVWAWDARPFPAFPNAVEIWSDGENYLRGHWLNGRAGQRTLASVVRELCEASDVTATDISALYGMVHGYSLEGTQEARAALQPLMLRHGFDAIEQDGLLRFRLRTGTDVRTLSPDLLVDSAEVEGSIAHHRSGEAELAGRVRLRFAQWGANFDLASEEAVLPDDATHAVSQSDLPLVMTRAEARQTVERWLVEARISRDSARFVLPPSLLGLAVGDVVELPGSMPDPSTVHADQTGTALFRLDRIEMAEAQLVEAVRIDPGVYLPADVPEDLPGVNEFVAPTPVLPLFMDLPLMTGEEVPHAPHLALTAQPWPGTVAVYGAQADEGYVLEEIVAARSVVGVTETPLAAGPVGRWDLGADLQLRLISGQLETREALAVLNGANVAAIGDGSNGNWEVFQFREAELVAPNTYFLRGRLRGQLGSDGLMPEVWPQGSYVVLLDGTQVQLELALAQRRIARHYRIGPARRGYEDPSYVHRIEAFDGNGLRPYAPVHLRLSGALGADLQAGWIRRTRIEGDSWDLPEVPLGEASEQYRVRVMAGATLLREAISTTAEWTYTTLMQAADGAAPGDRIEVAQLSDRYGAGFAAVAELA